MTKIRIDCSYVREIVSQGAIIYAPNAYKIYRRLKNLNYYYITTLRLKT